MSATNAHLIDDDGYNDDDDSNYDHSDDSDYDVYDDSDYTDDDNDNYNKYDTCDEDDNSDDGNDTLCALCDDGGKIISCIGQCKRSFHPRKKDGKESKCKTLGYTSTQLKEIGSFLCKNCEYKQHQCFKCGELEPSTEPNAKVFKCNNPSCGHFYHPKCVAKLLESNGDGSCELEKQIMEGIPFTCPMHWCFECGRVENKTRRAMQFAMCRRCPKSYHIECLPREISFERKDKNIKQRAWNLPGIAMIYCLDHKICRATRNGKRDHIKFPKTPKIIKVQDLAKQKGKMVSKQKRSIGQCSVKSIKALDKLPREKFEHTQNSLRHMVLKPEGSTMRLKKDLQIEPYLVEATDHCLKEGMQIEPSVAGVTNQSNQITLKWQKKQPRSSIVRNRMLSSHVDIKTKKRRTSRPKKERTSTKSYISAKKCVDHPIQENLLEDPPTFKDTELDKVTHKIPKDKDGRKEKSSMHLGEEDGATNEYTFHGNNERNDESSKLFMDAKLDDNTLKSRVEIDMQLGENVDRHDSIIGQGKDISMEDNQMSQSMCEQESKSVKRKTARNGSTKSSGSNGGFASYHAGDNPLEKLLHGPQEGNMVITNRIHNQPQYACDKDQEVKGGHTFQHDSTRWQNPYFHPRSPGYFSGVWNSSPYYPTTPMHVDFAQNANNFPIHGYDECNNFMHVGYNARGIAPTAIYPSLQLNNSGAYQSHTHVTMQGNGAAYGGHNREYGVRSHYTLSLGPHPQARRSVMDKYAPNLEQTKNQVRS